MTVRDSLRSIGSWLRRNIIGPQVEVSKANLMAVFALFIIAIIALMIRLLPMMGFETMVRAFDPWYNFREVQYIIENGFQAWFGWYDTSTWVPIGRNIPRSSYPGIPFTTALMYLALQGVGIHIDLMTVAVLFPAIMGVFGVIAMYFLGVEVASKEIGLFAAFFMAIIPAYTQRTIAGFFDNEAIGIFAIILVLFFFMRALRKGSIASAIMGGLSMGYLAASWSVYIYMFQLFAIFALIMVLIRRYSRRLLLAYSGVVLTGMAIAVCVPRIGPDFPTSTTGLIPLGIFGLLMLIEFSQTFRLSEMSVPGVLERTSTRIRPYLAYIFGAMCALIVVGLGYMFQSGLIINLGTGATGGGILGNIAGKFYTVIDPLIRQNAFLLASVGEHLPAPWATFWYNLTFLVLLMPFGFYIAFRRERETDILLIIFALTALYFSGSMIRLVLLLSPAAAILGAYGLMMAIRPLRPIFWQRPILTRRRRRITPPASRSFATTAYLFIIVLLLASTFTSLQAVDQMGAPEITPGGRNPATQDPFSFRDYIEAFTWMRHHTPEDSVIVSWWDYGYWTRQVGNRSTVVDNATINKTQIGWVGRMFMETDPVEALRICQRFGVDYVFVHFGLGLNSYSGDEGKWQWMIRIAGEAFGDEVPHESVFWNETDGTYKAPYWQTLIYNMLWVNSTNVDPEVGNRRPRDVEGNPGPMPGFEIEPGGTIFRLFEPVYFSQVQFMKIFKCNYTYLESSLALGGASAYAVHQGASGIEDLSSVVVEVKNTGEHPLLLDSADIGYWDARNNRYSTDHFSNVWLTTTSGTLRLEPGETTMLHIRAQPYFTVGTDVNVTVNAARFRPALNATVTVPVRSAPAYELTPIPANSYAYANGTVHVEFENTGEGYLEIDKEATVEDTDIPLAGTSDRGRLLFTGERISFTLDTDLYGVSFGTGDTITVTVHYMSFLPTYSGLNVTISITVQATPIPSAPPPAEASNQQTAKLQSMQPSKISPPDYFVAPFPSLLCTESSSFFILRRYEP
jgi:dolichyl-diphosphooligosaccharide--protein glycosyltransferase